MKDNSFISKTEQKLIISLFFALCIGFYSHFAITQIEGYNQSVELEQSDKLYKANTLPNERISFSNCFFGPPLFSQLFWLQIFLNPFFLLILIKSPTFNRFLVISLFNLIFTISISYWLLREFSLYLTNETIESDYFSQLSHISAFGFALLQIGFSIITIWLIIRFVIERFQVKIELK